jgi:hypothetical protein
LGVGLPKGFAEGFTRAASDFGLFMALLTNWYPVFAERAKTPTVRPIAIALFHDSAWLIALPGGAINAG